VDAATLLPSRIFGACVEDSQCPGGEEAFCRGPEDGYPGGYCTIACDDRTACDDGSVYNHCLTLAGATSSTCERRCRNGSDCRDTYSCAILRTTPEGMAEGVCIPVCASDADCGSAHCNTYSGRCGTGVPTSGGETGDPCTSAAQCRSGSCRAESTGFVGGYCDGPCRLPAGFNTSDFFGGDELPAGNCPGAAVCIPGNQYGEGDLGTCLASCTSSADCRPGYGCQQNPTGSHAFTNGFCVPAM
jgi:hypothetical protein